MRQLVRNPCRDWLPLRHVAIEERLAEFDQMAKITRLCVASDSTNQPERKSGAWASKTPSMIPKVIRSRRTAAACALSLADQASRARLPPRLSHRCRR